MTKKVFISYAREDADVALFDDLCIKGVAAWLDTEMLLPGERWRLGIQNAIRECD